jgi:ADP-ribose pyrophosphatase
MLKPRVLPELLSSETKFDGYLIAVRVDHLRRDDGVLIDREVVSYGHAVVLVPVDAEGRLLMVRQYRHAVGEWLLELPAGGVDDGDASPAAAAQRELREETGHRGVLTAIGGIFLAPGYSDEYQHVFAATDLVADALDADEDEDLELERVPLADAMRRVGADIRDAKSIASLMLFARWRGME